MHRRGRFLETTRSCSHTVQPTAKAVLGGRQCLVHLYQHAQRLHPRHTHRDSHARPGEPPPRGNRAAAQKPPLSTYKPGVPRSLQHWAAAWCGLAGVAGEHPSPGSLPGCLWSTQAFKMHVELQSKASASGAACPPALLPCPSGEAGEAAGQHVGSGRRVSAVHGEDAHMRVPHHCSTPIP